MLTKAECEELQVAEDALKELGLDFAAGVLRKKLWDHGVNRDTNWYKREYMGEFVPWHDREDEVRDHMRHAKSLLNQTLLYAEHCFTWFGREAELSGKTWDMDQLMQSGRVREVLIDCCAKYGGHNQ